MKDPAAAAQAPAQVAGAAMEGKPSCFPKGEVVMDLDPRDLRIPQMVESNNVCTLFEYYKLGLSMGIPDEVLTQNTTKISRLEMLVLARQLNRELEVSDFFVTFFTDVC